MTAVPSAERQSSPLKERARARMKAKSISATCKYFTECPLGWDCLVEITLMGSAIWSVELCYATIALAETGFIEMANKHSFADNKVRTGMVCTFRNQGETHQ